MGRYLDIAKGVPPRREPQGCDGPGFPAGFGRPEEWPPESMESLRIYRVPHSLLYPLVGRKVRTPQGTGRLLQVFAPLAAVALDSDPERAAVFEPSEIRPEKGVSP